MSAGAPSRDAATPADGSLDAAIHRLDQALAVLDMVCRSRPASAGPVDAQAMSAELEAARERSRALEEVAAEASAALGRAAAEVRATLAAEADPGDALASGDA